MSLVISAKNLGDFAYPDACPRCLWVKLHVPRLPYQTFPGIFSSIDAYNKRVVHSYFDREGRMPDWLAPVGDVVGYIDPPPFQRFSIHDEETGVTLRGAADGIFRLRDGSHAIVDYKTARYTRGQDGLRPVYDTQLNGYAYIAERIGPAPISTLALIYMEPSTDSDVAAHPATVEDAGFRMGLSATVVPVTLDPESVIPPLLRKARETFDQAVPPSPKAGCKDCQALDGLVAAVTPDRQGRLL